MTKTSGIWTALAIALFALMVSGIDSCIERDNIRMQRERRQHMRDCKRLLGLAQTADDSLWVRFNAPTSCAGRWTWPPRRRAS